MKKKYFVSVAAIFNKKGEILLAQRNEPESKYSHEKWHLPGGEIEFGEHPVETVIREIKEEIGIEIDIISKNPSIHTLTSKDNNIHATIIAYTAMHKKGKINFSNDPQTKDAKWYTVSKINYSLCLETTEEIVETALKNYGK